MLRSHKRVRFWESSPFLLVSRSFRLDTEIILPRRCARAFRGTKRLLRGFHRDTGLACPGYTSPRKGSYERALRHGTKRRRRIQRSFVTEWLTLIEIQVAAVLSRS